jgi:hypothetical protein
MFFIFNKEANIWELTFMYPKPSYLKDQHM